MVSQPDSTSRDRLLAAAAEEFAARGYDGARVEQIARRARVNKAMVYYHFASKAALYRTVLVDVFQALAASVARSSERSGAEAQLSAFIRAIAGGTATHPHFPSMWLRELADGGRHLDATVLKQLGAILQTLSGILETGRLERRFRSAHPLIIQMGIVAPLLLFQASAPARERLGRAVPGRLPPVDRETFLAHLEATTIAALRVETATRTLPSPREKRR